MMSMGSHDSARFAAGPGTSLLCGQIAVAAKQGNPDMPGCGDRKAAESPARCMRIALQYPNDGDMMNVID
jgi:hypothetical protein